MLLLLPLMYFVGRVGSTFLHVGTVLTSLSTFIILKNHTYCTSGIIYGLIKKISSVSFGIYLCQMVIYRVLTIRIYAYMGTEWYMQIVVMISTFIGAYILTYALSKFSFKKYIVG